MKAKTNPFLVGIVALLSMVPQGCAWSISDVRSNTLQELEPKKKITRPDDSYGILCSRLPIKIIAIDGVSTYESYRNHSKSAFMVEPGIHSVEVRYGDDMQFQSDTIEMNVRVRTHYRVELEIDRVAPSMKSSFENYTAQWSVREVVNGRACK